MTADTAALLAAAGLAAGAINTVAGGGSLVSFPALLLAGYPTLTANVTNLLAVMPGYLGGTLGYRAELVGQGHRFRRLGAAAALGALAGTVVLLTAPASAFDAIVPFLVLLAVALLVAQPRLLRARRARAGGPPDERGLLLLAVIFAGGVYGGYFGAGLGIMLLALLAILIEEDLQRLNAVKGVLSLVVSVAAALVLGVWGPVDWPACAVIAVASLAGGRLGAGLARRMSPLLLRRVVAVYGAGVAIALLLT
jgi:uncharacterized protein